MKYLQLIPRLFTTGIGRIVVAWFIASWVLDHPSWIGWVGNTMKEDVLGAAYFVHRYALLAIAALSKQWNETGGSKAVTPEAQFRLAMDEQATKATKDAK